MTRGDRAGSDPAWSPGAAAGVHASSPPEQAASTVSRFVLAADPAAPGLARARIREWLGPVGWPEEERDDIEYAVSEAVSNAAEHAYPPGQRGEVMVDASIETLPDGSRRVRVVVRDQGRWRPERAEAQYRRRGIFLMSAFVDEVAVRRDLPGGGTEVILTAHAVPAADPRRGA